MISDRTRTEPFFLETDCGTRFCVLHRPATGVEHSSVLYVHPFAEEMNKTRRMAAVQSRALAALGYVVLQMDLFGCGDSSGNLGDASIPIWCSDIQAAVNWLHTQCATPLTIWGLRFGCLLAAHWASTTSTSLHRLLFWQPIIAGEAHLNQFLRIGTAAALLTPGSTAGTGASLRGRLADGETVEVAGYDISPNLARGMDALRIGELPRADTGIDWFEIVSDPGNGLLPASERIIAGWRAKNVELTQHAVRGDPFWATVEITDCHALLEATTHSLEQRWLLSSPSAR